MSTRLAVAASGSASARDVSAQKALLAQDEADHLPAAPRRPARRKPETTPARCVTISFSIFIASTTQTTAPTPTASPSATSTFSTVPCMGVTTASLLVQARRDPLTTAPRQLHPGRLRLEHGHVVTAAADLDRGRPRPDAAVRR